MKRNLFELPHSKIVVNHIKRQNIYHSIAHTDRSHTQRSQLRLPNTDRSTLELALHARFKTEEVQLQKNNSTLLLRKKKKDKIRRDSKVIKEKKSRLPSLKALPTIRLEFEGSPSPDKIKDDRQYFSSKKSMNNEFKNYVVRLK